MDNREAIEKLRAYLKCQKRQTKGIYYACNNKKCDDCDLCYMQGTTGEHLTSIELAIQALAKLEDNEPGCRCNSSQTNAEKIRSMSDEELADVLFDSCLEVMKLEECTNTDNCGVCKRCVLEWLQSEAE